MPTQHSAIVSANCHEPKGITSATTADAGKVITPSDTTNGESELRLLDISELSVTGAAAHTGWGQYSDATNTSGSPQVFTGSARTKLTIDGAGSQTNTSYLPGGDDLWDTVGYRITPQTAFDFYVVRLTFEANPTGASDYFDIELDIGGSINTIWQETRGFLKGVADHKFSFTIPVYTGTTFLANGGELYITPSASLDIWGAGITICKVHSEGV